MGANSSALSTARNTLFPSKWRMDSRSDFESPRLVFASSDDQHVACCGLAAAVSAPPDGSAGPRKNGCQDGPEL